MVIKFQIVHILPDKTEQTIATVNTSNEVQKIVETARYAGTWISDSRKLLRYGRGEIIVKKLTFPPRIIRHKTIMVGSYRAYDLVVQNDPSIEYIRVDQKSITGYAADNKELWQTGSFTKLCTYVSKEIAYDCFKFYERLLTEFNLAGAI